jgi:Trm5-related predicted tRNA methylase|tara:strand:+ start:480 stop:707 length:228 start_codon:yes stop_codon:yes gene_type:complete
MANSDKRIIYKESDGIVAVICPADKTFRTVEEIAKKDVPTGFKYKIVDKDDIPTDLSFRDAWTVDDSDLTDGVGA